MTLNRLLKITNDRETCEFCPYMGCACDCCEADIEPITDGELQDYYQEIREVLAESSILREKLEQEYIDGAKYAIYEIMKESNIPGSQAIRDSGGTIDMMCAAVADKIRAALEDE